MTSKMPRTLDELANRVSVLTKREEKLKRLSAYLNDKRQEVEKEVKDYEKIRYGYLAVAEELLKVKGLVEVGASKVVRGTLTDLDFTLYNAQGDTTTTSSYAYCERKKKMDPIIRVNSEDEEIFNLGQNKLEKVQKIRNEWLKSQKVIESLEAAEKSKKELILIAEKIKTVQRLQNPTREELGYLEQALEVSSSPLSIGKNQRTSYNPREYTLLIGGVPVLRVDKETGYSFIASPSNKKSLAIRAIGEKPSLRDLGARMANLGLGDFCTADGVKIFGEARDNIAEIFSKVYGGEQILPKDFEKINTAESSGSEK